MTVTGVIAYCLLLVYASVERLLRQGAAALELTPEPSDQGSTNRLLITSLITLIALVVAPVINHYGWGNWANYHAAYYTSWVGVLCMLGGLVLRYLAAMTLGEFYTRTLRICEDHRVVETGPYRFIRHPGYLGTVLIGAGAGLAVSNWLVFWVVLVPNLLEKQYRIRTEEKMMHDALPEKYARYVENTWRLIPFIY